jgi:hypothetical protein
MTRSRSSAKAAGTRFERLLADYFAEVIDDRIDRRPKNGAKDKGDIGNVRAHGQRVVIEAKDYGGQLKVGPWLGEAETERVNDDALAGVVIAKRRGKGNAEDQIVLMTVSDFTALITGARS